MRSLSMIGPVCWTSPCHSRHLKSSICHAIKPSSPPKWTILQRHLFSRISKTRRPMKTKLEVSWSSHRDLSNGVRFDQLTRSDTGLQSRLEKWTSSSFAFAQIIDAIIAYFHSLSKYSNSTINFHHPTTMQHYNGWSFQAQSIGASIAFTRMNWNTRKWKSPPKIIVIG